MTPEALDKQSKRLATICQRATVWGVLSEGIGLDLQADSLLVSSWPQGRWRCHNQGYADRVAECVETKYELSCRANVRAANAGRDIFRHEYREDTPGPTSSPTWPGRAAHSIPIRLHAVRLSHNILYTSPIVGHAMGEWAATVADAVFGCRKVSWIIVSGVRPTAPLLLHWALAR
eukprot:9404007-Pyramimonas_sp.AAC.1